MGGQLVHKRSTDLFASTLNIGLYYSQNKQYNISLAGEMFLGGKNHKIGMEFAKVFWPDVYYGIGNSPPESDKETFTTRTTHVRLAYQYRVVSALYAGLQFYYNNTSFLDFETNRSLATGTVPGNNGGGLPTAGLLMSWDTRDENVYPTSGSYHQLTPYHGGSMLGNDFAYSIVSLDLRHYMSLSDDQIFAFRAITQLASGQRPFYQLSRLGDFLRGYFQPRYRDRDLLAVQCEFRTPVWWRFGAVAFAGVGQVAPDINGFALRELKPSVGFGIRFALIPEQKVNLRIDIGVGKSDSTMDINLLESF